jgi:hypothetical protein
VGSSPKVVLESGRRRDGLAVARSFSAPIWPVVAISGGPPVEGRGKMESPHLGEGPHASGESWGTMVGCGGNGVSSSVLAMGKSYRGALRCSYL